MSERDALRRLGQLVGHRRVDQIAYLVPDLEEAIADWNAALGEREWLTWTYSPRTLPKLGFRGSDGDFVMRIALSAEAPQVELIQPVGGPSIYHEWIERRGYGPHHVGRFVEDIDAIISEMRAIGVEPVQWGTGYGVDGDGGFAYYEFGTSGGTVVELIQPPVRRQPAIAL